MESLGLNKLTCFNAGSLTEKKKWKIDERNSKITASDMWSF